MFVKASMRLNRRGKSEQDFRFIFQNAANSQNVNQMRFHQLN